MKTQKGITLIALIITIIVLLILAVVAISSITNDGIINYAKNARTDYEAAKVNEATTLQNYYDVIYEATTEKITFKIQTRTYQAEAGMTFRDWITSDYNTDKGMWTIGGEDKLIYDNYAPVDVNDVDDKIVNGKEYDVIIPEE